MKTLRIYGFLLLFLAISAWGQELSVAERNAAQGFQARERQLRSKSSTDYLSLSKTLLNGAGRLGNNFDLFSGQGPRLP